MRKENDLHFVRLLTTLCAVLISITAATAQTTSHPPLAATALQYCAANGKSTYYEYIDYISMGTISRTSGAEPGGYFDGTALSTDIVTGTKYPITYSHANPRGGYVENWQIFIDWNGDGDFVDAGEKALTAVTYTTANYTDSILVPATAKPGLTRMRVMMSSNLYPFPSPCGTFKYGEVEDYSVNIIGSSACTESYEPNNTFSSAKKITVNTNILSQISTATDKDWFAFRNNVSSPNIKITLSTLPADYNIQLFDSAGTLVATSATAGTVDETIVYNTLVTGIWKIKVYAKSGAFSNTQCYTLQAAISAAPGLANSNAANISNNVAAQTNNASLLSVYPNPAQDVVTLLFNARHNGTVQISVYDLSGQLVQQSNKEILQGKNQFGYRLEKLSPGIYQIKINGTGEQLNAKLVVK